MRYLALVGAMMLALFFTTAQAQDKVCPVTTLDAAIKLMDSQGTVYQLVPADKVQEFVDVVAEVIVGKEIEGVTNVVLTDLGRGPVFGLEIDGCLGMPIPFPADMFKPARLQGKQPDGSVHA